MTIRNDKMGQSWLLPPAVSDLIPVDHICYLVIAIVNSMDVSEVEKKYRFTPGNPAYSRRMLLRLVLMAAIDAVWSSTKPFPGLRGRGQSPRDSKAGSGERGLHVFNRK